MANLLRLSACLFVLLSFNAKALVINGCTIEAGTSCPFADLSRADLSGFGANLSYADLSYAYIGYANLRNADLRNPFGTFVNSFIERYSRALLISFRSLFINKPHH